MISTEYLAGLVDGEGSIYIRRVNGNYSVTFIPTLTITNTDKQLLDMVAMTIGGRLYLTTKQRANDGSKYRRPCFNLDIRGRAVGGVLSSIRPFLLSKCSQADAVIEAASMIGKPGRRTTESIRYRLSELADYVSWLNHGCP